MPDSVEAAIWGGVLAGLGYVAKVIWEKVDEVWHRKASRKSSLIHLQSLLLATRSTFSAQAKIRDRLCQELENSEKSLRDIPYDEILAVAFSRMSDAQK